MPILFSQSSSNNFIPSLKILLISTSVVSAAVAFKLSAPAVTDYAPSFYNAVVSWLRPPYLYLVINCIIITIVASSKFQSKPDDGIVASSPSATAYQLERTPVSARVSVQIHPQPIDLEPVKQYYSYDSAVMKAELEVVESVRQERFEYRTDSINTDLKYYQGGAKGLGTDKEFIDVNTADAPSPVEVKVSNYNDEFTMSKSSPSPLSRRDSSEFSVSSSEKPPASARFAHRRAVKASPEGGKAALGVSKSRRQDTLESTWKTITEGRAMPLTRHLRKSDTWEVHGGHHHSNQTTRAPQSQKMTKAEAFQERSSRLLRSSPGSGKLKKEPSLGQDELNKRVEAFIHKFNEEMRLQRQESLNQYMEMINRGAH